MVAARTKYVQLETEWCGPAPAHLDATPEIASRAACDISPIDIRDDDQALRLQAYVWADQPHRLERLRRAITLARQTGVNLEQADAAEWLETRLGERPKSGLTVLFHSVFLHYPSPDIRARILAIIAKTGREATDSAPFAWLCYETEAYFGGPKGSGRMAAQLKVWPGEEACIYGRSDGHVMAVDANDSL